MAFSGHEQPNRGKSDVWLTPLELIGPLGRFDLDPCGESDNPTAETIYERHGLEQPWFGRVWLNPPYSEVGVWLRKMAQHNNGIALVFARLDVKWEQEIIPSTSSVFFPKGRLRFNTREGKAKSNAGAPSMFLSWGDVPAWNLLGEGLVWKTSVGREDE